MQSRARSNNRSGVSMAAVKALAIAVAAIVVAAGIYLYWSWNRPLNPGPETYIVRPGTSLRALAAQLKERRALRETESFVWLGYLTGRARTLKAGEYRFRPGITSTELLDQVVAGRVVEYPVIVIEGWTFSQFRKALAAAPRLEQTLAGVAPEEIMARLGRPGVHPEGRFFPDTYYYSSGHTDLMILARALEKMEARLEAEWRARAADVPLRTSAEALTLASIVEKETGRPEERRMIAGVFVNRLRKGMRLQSDPTVIYGIGPTFDGNIRLKDLKQDTPYNTYVRTGLPPTPIAMPGAEALAAALHPQKTDALYFVARGDGSHVFSATLEQHNEAVIKYQLRGRRTSFSSSPAPKKKQAGGAAPAK